MSEIQQIVPFQREAEKQREREVERDLEAVKLPISVLISITGTSQSSHMIDS